jgi:hypothetical protein
VSWPYSPSQCPRCRYLEHVDPPIVDDVGYETVGVCRHPRIAMELFKFKLRDPDALEPCRCFREQPSTRPASATSLPTARAAEAHQSRQAIGLT